MGRPMSSRTTGGTRARGTPLHVVGRENVRSAPPLPAAAQAARAAPAQDQIQTQIQSHPHAQAEGDAGVASGDVLAGKYRVLRLLGRGGMGVVVEAEHAGQREHVAIKVMHDRYTSNAEAMARFHLEARAAVKIRGEHSARMLDAGTTPRGGPFLVMELLRGQDLASLLKHGPIPIEDAVLYVLQACDGMAEVHANGIIHRDLKPGNLFLTRRPDGSPLVKVLDFGIAKSASPADQVEAAMTMTMVSLGTPLYMSPEQVRCSKAVDPRTDVWSLGAILYELLAGIPAFHGNSVANISAQVLESTPPDLPLLRSEISHQLNGVVQKALSKRPDQRYPDVAALAQALAPFAGARGTVHAERAANTLRQAYASGTVASPSVPPPGGTLHVEAATTLRIVRGGAGKDQLLKVMVALLAVAVVIIGAATLFAYRESASRASGPPAMKGIAAAAAVRQTEVITAARFAQAVKTSAPAATAAPSAQPSAGPTRGRPPPKKATDPLGTRK